MNHRNFLLAVSTVLTGSGALQSPVAHAAPPDGRPNFLFIFTDDQRWDALGCVQREQGEKGRFPWIQTPNMDRIAAEGLRFRQAFVVNSLCSPSRACFLTGRYNHLNGVANNQTVFPLDSVTHATELRKAGYRTGYFGKWHMLQQKERPGFDVAASFTGQGWYSNCTFVVNGVETPSMGYADDVTTDYAIEFIKQTKEKPFSMVVGFKAPHNDRTPPDRRKNDYTDVKIVPAVSAGIKAPYATSAPGKEADPTTPDRRNYMRCISGADDNVGRLLKTLDELGMVENTVVIFASDNGYYMDEHGLGDKRSAYDESLRIPLLVRWPRVIKPGRVADEMVLNIDLPSTLLDLAGVPVPPLMQGCSWRPLLEGKAPAGWRKAFFYEYFYEAKFGKTPTTLAVRTGAAKLIRYPGHDEWTELFDLKADPLEMTNLWNCTEAKLLRESMTAEFDRQAQAVNFCIPDYADKPQDGPVKKTGGTE